MKSKQRTLPSSCSKLSFLSEATRRRLHKTAPSDCQNEIPIRHLQIACLELRRCASEREASRIATTATSTPPRHLISRFHAIEERASANGSPLERVYTFPSTTTWVRTVSWLQCSIPTVDSTCPCPPHTSASPLPTENQTAHPSGANHGVLPHVYSPVG